jgi:16S rRNA (cytosine967-C5)-methyltransferase
MTRKNSRLVAIETLSELQRKNTPLPLLFQQICDRHELEGADRSLAMNLIYGVLRNYRYLETVMGRLCRHPLKKLHPLVFQGLAVGLYQLLFLDRIPPSAAVNETVNAVKAAKIPKRLHGFVNGVLRQSIRQRDTLPPPDAPGEDGQPILNHPDWLTTRWAARFGTSEMQAICRSNNNRQPLTLRINGETIRPADYLSLLLQQEINAVPGRYAPEALLLEDYSGPITALPGFREGYFQVQGEAAQLAALLLRPFRPKGRYLDGCAGLGGKTGHLLQLLAPYGAHLTAVEPEPNRLDKLQGSLTTLTEHENLTLFKGNLRQFREKNEKLFDGILIDAPCSGTGIIGRQPDIRWRRQPEDILRYSAIQRELLNLAASILLPGGILVYATCSLEDEENMANVSAFLHENSRFSLTDCAPWLPEETASLIREGCFQPLPSENIDGFFAARLVRNITDD